MSSRSSSGSVSSIQSLDRPSGIDDSEVDILAIPGPGTLKPRSWANGDGSLWLTDPRLETIGKFAAFEHTYSLNSRDDWTGSALEDEGTRLLEGLSYLIEKRRRPIVVIAHSIGNLVLKRAVSHARSHHNQHLLDRIAVLILISGPHCRKSDINKWQTVETITKWFAKCRKNPFLSQTTTIRALSEDCQAFEEAFITTPVLSIYEEVETKRLMKSSWRVDRTLAQTGVRNEHLIGVHEDHEHSCCLSRDRGCFEEVEIALRDVVRRTVPAASSSENPSQDIRPHVIEDSDGLAISPDSVRHEMANFNLQHARIRSESPTFLGHNSYAPRSELANRKLDPKLPCFVMPYYQNYGFFARSDVLAQISSTLDLPAASTNSMSTESSGLRSFALSGLAGIGKTQIAIEFVYRSRAKYDAVFWIQADSLEKIAQGFSRIAVDLGLVVADSINAKDKVLTRRLVLGWLAKPVKTYRDQQYRNISEASWLLVFDSADNLEMLANYWPPNGTGAILITTKDPVSDRNFCSPTAERKLGPFDNKDAAEFLLRLTRRQNDREDCKFVGEVTHLLGCHPLAMAQMAGIIARRDLSFAEFAREYKDESKHKSLLEYSAGPRSDSTYQHTIASVWHLHNLEQGASLLDVLSFYDPDSIPEDIFLGSNIDTDIEGLPRTEENFVSARTELFKSSLIVRARSTKRLAVHRLVQDTARSQMSEEKYCKVFTSALQLISAVWPHEDEFGSLQMTKQWTRCSALYPHVLNLYKLRARYTPPRTLSKAHLEPPRLLQQAALFSIMQAQFEDTEVLIDMAAKMIDALQNSEETRSGRSAELLDQLREQKGLVHFHRGLLALHINRPDLALPNLQTWSRIVIDRVNASPTGPDFHTLSVTQNELGIAYLQNDKTEQAEKCFVDSVDALKDYEDASAHHRSMPMINLGFVYWLQGRYAEAERVFQQTMDERRRAYGPDDKESFITGKLLLGFGNLRASQSRMDESLEFHERSLDVYQATVSYFHHRTGDACVHVAEHYMQRGRYDEARKLLEHALMIYNERHFRPELARVHYKRSKLYHLLGKAAEGQQCGREALRLFRLKGQRHEATFDDLSDSDFDNDIMFWSR